MNDEVAEILEERRRKDPTGRGRLYKDYKKEQRRTIRRVINCSHFIVSMKGPRLGVCRRFNLPIYDTNICRWCRHQDPIR